MSDEDAFIQEVDDELRRERLEEFWKKYGKYIWGACIGVVALVGGVRGWETYRAYQAGQSAETYLAAHADAKDNKTDEAIEAFGTLAKSGPAGYQLLSKLQIAANLASQGKSKEALAQYEDIAKHKNYDSILRDFAVVQAALLRVDEAPFEEIETRLKPLNNAANPWRHSARELMGLSAYQAKNYEQAEMYFNLVLSDQAAPGGLRNRASNFLELVLEKTARKVTTPKQAAPEQVKSGSAENGASKEPAKSDAQKQ